MALERGELDLGSWSPPGGAWEGREEKLGSPQCLQVKCRCLLLHRPQVKPLALL